MVILELAMQTFTTQAASLLSQELHIVDSQRHIRNTFCLNRSSPLGRVWHNSMQLKIRKTNSAPNFVSQTRPTPATPLRMYSIKR
jgi:hypothetical protein